MINFIVKKSFCIFLLIGIFSISIQSAKAETIQQYQTTQVNSSNINSQENQLYQQNNNLNNYYVPPNGVFSQSNSDESPFKKALNMFGELINLAL